MRCLLLVMVICSRIYSLEFLSTLAPQKPWLDIEANSEQRQPVYFGLTPLQIELGYTPKTSLELDFNLKTLGEKQLLVILKKLKEKNIIIESWLVNDEYGGITWAFARYKKGNDWIWLNKKDYSFSDKIKEPSLPLILRTWIKREHSLIFDDFLTLNDLYSKPFFGQCIWVEKDTENVNFGWLKNSAILDNKNYYCAALSQPCRFNGKAISFHINVNNNKIFWDERIHWIKKKEPKPQLKTIKYSTHWPDSFISDYKRDVCILSGECEAIFPISNKKTKFIRKNNAEKSNQLDELIDYLIERYKVLGIKTFRHKFNWRKSVHSNLIAVIPGKGNPVILADHIDTAFAEEVFDKEGIRKSVPGADDNASATAVLLRAAEILRNNNKPIWLLHLTGEEFPADDLGARKFVSSMLKSKTEIDGVVILDMIGYRQKNDPIFQINAGESELSVKIAEYAFSVAKSHKNGLEATYRSRFDEKSYLYNTDGIIFSDAGYPVILINEHINKLENIDRPHYHQMTDTISRMDFFYATSIAKIAIETVLILSSVVL